MSKDIINIKYTYRVSGLGSVPFIILLDVYEVNDYIDRGYTVERIDNYNPKDK